MNNIEKYSNSSEGYHPFLIREGWQIAQLNYCDAQHIDNINKLDVHNHTDEVFILLKGKVALIVAKFIDDLPVFQVELMQPNITYNIPQNTWHNIAMEKDSEVLIVEKSNTHLSDFQYHYLDNQKIKELNKLVTDVFL